MTTHTQNHGALAGIKIIDLSRVLGGPLSTQILADHGADVLKIEPPQGDETRGWGPPFTSDGTAAYFQGLNRNKRGMQMDLYKPEDRAALLELLAHADVLVENFKTGSMEKWGLGWESLHAQFPRLIHCRVSGYGADGPLGGLPGYDAALQAWSGIMTVNGEKGGSPLRAGIPVVDVATGMSAALGIMLALFERQRSGLGQFVESSLYDNAMALLHPHSANHLQSGQVPGRTGNAHPNITPYDTYATRSEPIFLAVGNDTQFANLCKTIGKPDLPNDPRFANNVVRRDHRDALRELLEDGLKQFDCTPLADTLAKAGVPCAPIQDIGQSLSHPHTAHREMVVSIGGDYKGIASPVKLSRTPATYRLAPPKLGGGT